MNLEQQLAQSGVAATQRTYADRSELVADFGPATDATVDVVGETVIVVAGDEQYEIDVEGEAQAFIRNGVLTIEVSA